MKVITALTALFMAFPAAGSSGATDPLLELTNHPGFVPVELAGSTVCRIFENGVETVRQLGAGDAAVILTERREISVTGNIEGLIGAASAAELLTEANFLCDGPSSLLTVRAPAGGERLVVFSTGGCGSPTRIRAGFIGSKLMQIAEVWCPAIHRAPGR